MKIPQSLGGYARMNRADMDFRFKGLFPVKMQEVCTDVFISCIYVFILKQKEIFSKKQQCSRNVYINERASRGTNQEASVNIGGSVLKIWLQVKLWQSCNITPVFHQEHPYSQLAGFLIQASERTKGKKTNQTKTITFPVGTDGNT